MSEIIHALQQLNVTVWAPIAQQEMAESQEQSSIQCQVIFPGENPLIAVWVDAWDAQNRQTLAKVLRFLHIPLQRCVIIGPGEAEGASALAALSSNVNKLFAFGALPKKLVDSLGTIEYVESIPLAQVVSDPSLKKQVLHELWEHRLPTD